MAFTEFYCQSGGDNLNAGSTADNAAIYTATGGDWDSGTGVFTPASGDPSATVSVGMFASVYNDGASAPTGFVARVTAVDSTTITLSTTVKSGTAPTTSTSNDRTIKVGGAWAGPSGTSGFPFNFIAAATVNTSGDTVRVNFKNNATYSVSAAMTHTLIGPVAFQGYSSTPGDGGKAIIDGGSTGASYVVLTVSGSGIAWTVFSDFVFSGNGATGNAGLVNGSNDTRTGMFRCVFRNSRGYGYFGLQANQCEAYGCNASNTTNTAGFTAQSGGANYTKCVSHDNAGSNSAGFYTQANSTTFIKCLSYNNGGAGFRINNVTGWLLSHCDAYANGSHGIEQLSQKGVGFIENCNLVANGGYGISLVGAGLFGTILNCGFGSGTKVNASGATSGVTDMTVEGSVTYAADVTPWNAPDSDDFTLVLAAARGAGNGTFGTFEAGANSTVSKPDIGAALRGGTFPLEEDVETGITYGAAGTEYTGTLVGGGGGLLVHPGMSGGMRG